MPKKAAGFSDRIETFCPPGTIVKLVAIAYHMGASGEYATPVRNFVTRGIREYISNLEGRDLKDFEEILTNVEIQMEDQNRRKEEKKIEKMRLKSPA